MEQTNGVILESKPLPDLGAVICKNCGNVMFTLPTNGVKTIYGVCKDNCQPNEGE
ncbi:GapA-binding peptide SR1P [Cohnella kolymensis]|uniref:GapA-binding peptide SR1P n=1 Tax=Cohnella kolymensis TaxID=1590652 RepID=UPI000AB6402B|nr:GapA-binding peptide SR1P [Cohnella kolymensis]